ncbi:MAG: NAD-dependent protein deacylase [Planctomycetes bacterium]|nr:NAD-dependent protein deacylase [Planctomycetota bacterium]
MTAQTDQLAEWLRKKKSVVAFTGAGISTESGIPDFRSPGGVWAKSSPVYYDDFLRSPDARYEYWRQKAELHQDFAAAAPNVAHASLAHWEEIGILRGVITQNIDGLHQLAGSTNVLELHGTAREVACLQCAARFDAETMVRQFQETDRVPSCPECGGLTKHATISFGQSLLPEVLQESTRWAKEADLFLTMGSSLVVEPAASLPRIAKEQGAILVILNRDSTPLDSLADSVINASLGSMMTEIAARLDEFLNSDR